jgi:hypothetical protein
LNSDSKYNTAETAEVEARMLGAPKDLERFVCKMRKVYCPCKGVGNRSLEAVSAIRKGEAETTDQSPRPSSLKNFGIYNYQKQPIRSFY